VYQAGLMQTLKGAGLFPIFIFNTLLMQVLFMSVIMEAIDGASERISRNTDSSITNFICFNL
jgi:hypothetical protein